MYLYVATVQYVVSLLLTCICYSLITRLLFFNIPFVFMFCFEFLFSMLCILCFLIIFVLFCVLFLLLCCLFPIFVEVYGPLPQGAKPIAENK